MMNEAQEAASAHIGAEVVVILVKIRAAQEAASTDSEVPAGGTFGIRTKEAQESSLTVQDTSRYV